MSAEERNTHVAKRNITLINDCSIYPDECVKPKRLSCKEWPPQRSIYLLDNKLL